VTQLVPCPDCQRHVRKTETLCPFCAAAVSLAHVPAPVLPSRRLGRAATFAFGATLLGATSVVGCSDNDDNGSATPVYGGPPAAGAGNEPSDQGGASGEGGAEAQPNGGMTTIYGGPPEGGAGGEAQEIGGAGPVNTGGQGGDFAIYGGPPGGAGAGGDGGR
jgi:hypothetical protein